jgi:hypothetical protein
MPCRGPVTGNENAILMRKRKVGKGEVVLRVPRRQMPVESLEWDLATDDGRPATNDQRLATSH